MLAAGSLPRISVSDYLAFEQDSEIRHELVDGYLYCDRGDKRLAYQSLSSLQEYMLVARDEPSIEIYRRTKAGWSRSSIGVSRRYGAALYRLGNPFGADLRLSSYPGNAERYTKATPFIVETPPANSPSMFFATPEEAVPLRDCFCLHQRSQDG